MYCKQCGARLDSDARFCQQCGAPAGASQAPQPQPYRRPVPGYAQDDRQPIRSGRAYRNEGRRRSPVKAGFQARLFGIPISGKAAIVILIILIIVAVILNKTGGLN